MSRYRAHRFAIVFMLPRISSAEGLEAPKCPGHDLVSHFGLESSEPHCSGR